MSASRTQQRHGRQRMQLMHQWILRILMDSRLYATHRMSLLFENGINYEQIKYCPGSIAETAALQILHHCGLNGQH